MYIYCEETGHRKIQQTVWLKYQLVFMAKLNVIPISKLGSNQKYQSSTYKSYSLSIIILPYYKQVIYKSK